MHTDSKAELMLEAALALKYAQALLQDAWNAHNQHTRDAGMSYAVPTSMSASSIHPQIPTC